MRIIMKVTLLAALALALPTFAAESAASAKASKAPANEAEKQSYLTILPTDIVMGDPKAPVTLIEYSSLTCPHCAHFQKNVFPEIKKNYVDTGKVKFVHRDFPLDEAALQAALLAHCAGKDRYYTFLKVLFDKQDSWSFEKNYLEILGNIGKLGGVSGEAFDKCLKDKALETTIVEGKLKAAKVLGVSATPTFFINGTKHSGAGGVKQFSELIEKALNGN